MKKAFTLIELLVVIAIIAILAAILFPVFAQAKQAAKKTASLSNIKQQALGVTMYGADTDDTMPNTLYGGGYAYGPGRADDFNLDDAQKDGVNSYYSNAIQPYIKSWDLYQDTSLKSFNPFGYTDRIKKFSYSLNGYLNYLSATSVNAPAVVPMFWMGQGNQSFFGYAHSWPQPFDNSTGSIPASNDYRFQRSGPSCTGYYGINFGGTFGGTYTWDYRVYGNTSNMAYVDGHAKSVNVMSGDFPWILDPKTGQVDSLWIDGDDAANGCDYLYVMAPTREND